VGCIVVIIPTGIGFKEKYKALFQYKDFVDAPELEYCPEQELRLELWMTVSKKRKETMPLNAFRVYRDILLKFPLIS